MPLSMSANPLRDQILQLWGKNGDWNAGGVDRAAELATMFQERGISDLTKLGMGTRAVDTKELINSSANFGDVGPQESDYQTVKRDRNFLTYDGNELGYFGADPLYEGSGYLQDTAKGANEFAWSPAGHGNVGYLMKQMPDGSFAAVPQWGSSSDMDAVRDAIKMVGLVVGGGMGLEALGFGGATAAGAEAGAAGAGAEAAAAAGGTSSAGMTTAEQIAAALGKAPVEASFSAAALSPEALAINTALGDLTGVSIGILPAAGELAANLAVPAAGAAGMGSTLLDAAKGAGKFLMDNGKWIAPLVGGIVGSQAGVAPGGGGGSPTAGAPGPAKAWGTPLQMGIQKPVQQWMPPAIQAQPGGLAMGAGRFLKRG